MIIFAGVGIVASILAAGTLLLCILVEAIERKINEKSKETKERKKYVYLERE